MSQSIHFSQSSNVNIELSNFFDGLAKALESNSSAISAIKDVADTLASQTTLSSPLSREDFKGKVATALLGLDQSQISSIKNIACPIFFAAEQIEMSQRSKNLKESVANLVKLKKFDEAIKQAQIIAPESVFRGIFSNFLASSNTQNLPDVSIQPNSVGSLYHFQGSAMLEICEGLIKEGKVETALQLNEKIVNDTHRDTAFFKVCKSFVTKGETSKAQEISRTKIKNSSIQDDVLVLIVDKLLKSSANLIEIEQVANLIKTPDKHDRACLAISKKSPSNKRAEIVSSMKQGSRIHSQAVFSNVKRSLEEGDLNGAANLAEQLRHKNRRLHDAATKMTDNAFNRSFNENREDNSIRRFFETT